MTPDKNAEHVSREQEPPLRRWWQRIQWIDVVLVVLAVFILLTLTAELWLPYVSVGHER